MFCNNPNFLTKFYTERKKLKKSLENFGNLEGKPNCDLILRRSKNNKVVETILILKNEKNLMCSKNNSFYLF